MNPVLKQVETQVRDMLQKLPRKLGAEAVRYSMQRFREQAWDDGAWPQRSPKAKRNSNRALLVDKGRLKRSIRNTEASQSRIVIGTDVPYAKAHNEGFEGQVTVKAHTRIRKFNSLSSNIKSQKTTSKRQAYDTNVKEHRRRMRIKRRQFLGDSTYLRRNLARIATADLNRIIKTIKK